MRALIAGLLLFSGVAQAQTVGSPTDCSGTVGTQSTAITFPSAGNHGSPAPHQYLTITNSAGTNKLAINVTGGAAVIDSSGSLPMDAVGAGWTWANPSYPPPVSVNIIASAGSTPFTCTYQ
jgi:hypothetical protein